MSLKCYLVFLCVSISVAYAQPSPYFPDSGVRSVEQDLLGLKNPSVYLLIAIAPGFEDFASIANFRIGRGSSVAVAYVTNGEDIPSDSSGEMFYQLASRRKEEAYQALSYLGVQTYFMNIPADEFSPTDRFEPTRIDKLLNSRLDSLMSEIKPDVVMLDHDPLSGRGQSNKLAYLKALILKDIRTRESLHLWNAKRFFIYSNDRQKASSYIPVEQKDPFWSKSYLQMAYEAAESYRSLKYQIPLWVGDDSHRYEQFYPVASKPFLPPDKGLPLLGKDLNKLAAAVHSVLTIERIPKKEKQLAKLSDVISETDALIREDEYSLDQNDLRVLTTWKGELEKLRCAILGVVVPFKMSDTVVTPLQLAFLRFGELGAPFREGKNRILFPGVFEKKWIVNESHYNFYDLKDSSEFRLLPTNSISMNSTETPQGFAAMQVRTPLPFIVVHQDSNPEFNFMYKHEIPLIIAPIRSEEVLTPSLVMPHDTEIVVRIKSNVDEKSGGLFYVSDPVVSSPLEKVELPGKDIVLTDTLPLIWKDTLLTAPHEVTIWASQRISIGSFVVYPLDVKANIKREIGFLSAIENSPIQIALHRLGVDITLLDTVGFSNKILSDYSAIIVDQFSIAKLLKLFSQQAMDQWIGKGGRLIVLPQYGSGATSLFPGDKTEFSYLPVIGFDEKVSTDSTEKISTILHGINEHSFDSERFVISYGGITGAAGDSLKVLMKSGDHILLLEKRIGLGAIFYCALNFYPRLLAIDHASYRFLTNLLEY